MKQLKFLGAWAFRLLKYPTVLTITYLLLALLGALIPTGNTQISKEGEILIFVSTNGLHSDIVVPLKNPERDWLSKFSPEFQTYQNYEYLAFGWGDYDFYLQSKTGTNLLDVFNTLFVPSRGILHLDFYRQKPRTTAHTRPVGISPKQYQKLCQYLDNQIVMNQNQQLIKIENGYGKEDYFFVARGSYHLFYTCNNWTNDALKAMALRTGIWTPFREGIWFWLP
ncbi:MAG: TIGR02117 family protein [Microscillaceae bacterium]|jgi:uncharacterized protein (TIGR02117 family)|nr:TIGR02117 family protein [Microscillaceae bacterium]